MFPISDAFTFDYFGSDLLYGRDLPDEELADATVEEVIAVRDALDLPTRLRELEGVDPDEIPAIAEFIVEDSPMEHNPEGFDPSARELETVIEDAW